MQSLKSVPFLRSCGWHLPVHYLAHTHTHPSLAPPASAPFEYYAELNKGKEKGDRWDMPKPSIEEMRSFLPKPFVEYMDNAGNTEVDAKLRSVEEESGIVIRQPQRTWGTRRTTEGTTPAPGNSASV